MTAEVLVRMRSKSLDGLFFLLSRSPLVIPDLIGDLRNHRCDVTGEPMTKTFEQDFKEILTAAVLQPTESQSGARPQELSDYLDWVAGTLSQCHGLREPSLRKPTFR